MSTATSFSKLGYLLLKKESAAGTAVYPDSPIEILSESIKPNWDFTPVGQIAGNRSMNSRPALNKVGPIEGDIELYVEPNTFGHFMNGCFGEDTITTLAAGVSVQHDWEPGNTLVAYTMDIKMAGEDYVTRYFGVRIKSVKFGIDNNILKATISISAQRVFTNARVLTAIGSGTALSVDQTSGLVAGSDTILVLSNTAPDTVNATLTVTTVTDETTLVVSTIGASLAVDDIVVIKAKTVDTEDYDLTQELIFSGGAQAYIANGQDAINNVSAVTNIEDFELTIENGLEPRWAATGNDVVDRMPSNILIKGVSVTGAIKKFHANPEFIDMLRKNEQVGLRLKFLGQLLEANVAAAASATIETDGAETLSVTVDTAGEAGNDYAIKIVQGTTTLSAALSGKIITVTLDTDAGDNTTTLVATAIDGLAGVACASTGTDLVTTTDNPDKINFGSGRDASEKQALIFDLPNARFQPFWPNLGEDDIVQEDIAFTAYRDADDEREINVRLRNDIAGY